MQSDPIGLAAGLNTYAYVASNPLTYRDLFGLDIDVCFFPRAAVGFGHVGFGPAGTGKTFGFYPTGDPRRSPGQVKQDEGDRMCKRVPADETQDRCMDRCLAARRDNPGDYILMSRQCTSFTRDCLRECGLATGTYAGPLPERFFFGVPGQYLMPDALPTTPR